MQSSNELKSYRAIEPSSCRARSGQAIIEALVALSLLVGSFLGVLTLLNRSLGISRDVSNTHTATYLAAEGIEVVKNLVDHNALVSGNSFFTGFESCTPAPCEWEVQYNTVAPGDTGVQPSPYSSPGRLILYDPATGLFQYSTGKTTPFTRFMRVALSGGNNEVVVESIVRWTTRGGGNSEVRFEDHFFNWH